MATSSEANKPPEPVTGYPVTYAYAAPPPQPQVLSASDYQNETNRQIGSWWSPLLCRLIIIATVIISVMGVASMITRLIVKPQFPEFRVDSASISQLNITSPNSMTATWHVSLLVKNPNKKLELVYDKLEASVLYGEWELDSTLVPPFSQEIRNETRVDFQAGVLSEYVDQSVTSGIEKEKVRGEVRFDVGVSGWVRFNAGWWGLRWLYMRVNCNGVTIGVMNNGGTAGDLVGPVSPCQVYFARAQMSENEMKWITDKKKLPPLIHKLRMTERPM